MMNSSKREGEEIKEALDSSSRGDDPGDKTGSQEENVGSTNVTDNGTLKKGRWTEEEDAILVEYVKKHGDSTWHAIHKQTGLARSGSRCRDRWINHLKPGLKKGESFTEEEQQKIIRLHAKIGNKWVQMAQELPGRSENDIKNFWNTRRKRLERDGTPLYPADVIPQMLDSNQENRGCSSQHVDASSEDKLNFLKHQLHQEYPSYIPSISNIPKSKTSEHGSDSFNFPMLQPPDLVDDSDKLYNSLGSSSTSNTPPTLIDHHDMFQDYGFSNINPFYGKMDYKLPPFPSTEETQQVEESSDELIQCPPVEETWSKPVSPRRNGLLDSIFFTPTPSTDESSDTQIQLPPVEETQPESVSPHSSGLLESILFTLTPKNSEGSDTSSMHHSETERDKQGEPNSCNKKNSN